MTDRTQPTAPAPSPVHALTDRLREMYPAVFCEPRTPLKVGIYEDILAAHPDIDAMVLSRVLRWWTCGINYQAALMWRMPRVGLDGVPCGLVDDSVVKGAILHVARCLKLPPDRIDVRKLHPDYRRAKHILLTTEPETALPDDQRAFVADLLSHHPNAADKFGAGLAEIRVTKEARGGCKFMAVRVDGSSDDFSLLKCFNHLRNQVKLPAAAPKKAETTAGKPPAPAQADTAMIATAA